MMDKVAELGSDAMEIIRDAEKNIASKCSKMVTLVAYKAEDMADKMDK